ncbi:MAG: ADP-ribosylation/crystallin J1 [Actinomycetota bacterium]
MLYRPVGKGELHLIAASGWSAFPPRLPGQPIFYPVLSEAYATRIAREWNTKDERSGFAGYVTHFVVETTFLGRYEVHEVGGKECQEYWIPAEDLDDFNRHLRGPITVIAEFPGGPPGAS